MKVTSITFSFANAPSGTVSVLVKKRKWNGTSFVIAGSVSGEVTAGSATVTFSELDGVHTFAAFWVDAGNVETPIDSAVIPAWLRVDG